MSALLTSLVGSYPQPEWLIDREALRGRVPARVRALELWRVDPRWLHEAQDDAVALAVSDQERAGLDIVTDGEIRRESYSNAFANALSGLDSENPGTTLNRSGQPIPVPRVVAPIRRNEAVGVEDLRFLRGITDRAVKVTVPGPFTMAQQAQNDFYAREEDLALAYADVVREEVLDLFAAGADVVQLDEPWMEARPEQARRYGVETVSRALDGVNGTTALHICFGYPAFVPDHPPAYAFLSELAATPVKQISIETAQADLDVSVLADLPGKTIILGVLALDSAEVESPRTVAERIGRALPHKDASELIAAPDCGMKYLPRDAAFAKLEALVEGARLASSGAF
jgi:5-methyltetrahydropteroyltriglutamate--homocysteine methyltransferase